MSQTRGYESPKRKAQMAATRTAIVEAFVEQLTEEGLDGLSPTDAALRAGVSVRTVHTHFPDRASRISAVADWIDRYTYPNGVQVAQGPDDLPRYFREVHTLALASPMTRVLLEGRGSAVWDEIRQERRAARLDAIRRSVAAVGAPRAATEDATAMLLSLAGADASLPLHDRHGLPLERVPGVIANTVELIITHLRDQAAETDRTGRSTDSGTAVANAATGLGAQRSPRT